MSHTDPTPFERASAAHREHIQQLIGRIEELEDVLRRLVTTEGISTWQTYSNGKVQLTLNPTGGDALSEARHLLYGAQRDHQHPGGEQ